MPDWVLNIRVAVDVQILLFAPSGVVCLDPALLLSQISFTVWLVVENIRISINAWQKPDYGWLNQKVVKMS